MSTPTWKLYHTADPKPDFVPTEPTKLLVAGDIHGDPQHVYYLFERALNEDCDALLQVGDFGYWEHYDKGAFLDVCSDLATNNNLPLYWIDGNHENHTWLRTIYGPGGDRHKPTPEEFWEIRPGVYYIPRGSFWVWNGITMMGLGGAYSVDKSWRRKLEEQGGVDATGQWRPPAGERTLWWPEEEITAEELALAKKNAEALNGERLDILFTHDKPHASNPPWARKELPECLPGQRMIQELVNLTRPRLLVHGHLHLRYTTQIRCGHDDQHTTVVGLDCNPEPPDNESDQAQERYAKDARLSWEILELRKDA